MIAKMKLYPILIACLVLSGCVRYSPRVVNPVKFYSQLVNAELSAAAWLTRYNSMPAATSADLAAKAAERNRLLSEFVFVIDDSYSRFETAFYAGKATEDVVGDFVNIGLTSATALTAAERVKTVLAVAATTASGGKASFDSRWFDAQSRFAVVAQMNALRADQFAAIETGMKQDVLIYTLGDGLSDIQGYIRAGSVVSALQAIATSSGTQAQTAKQTLKLIRQH